jgi:hypothetical protein
MPFFRCNFFFNSFRQGWTEQWYVSGSSLDSAAAAFSALSPAIIDFRSTDTTLTVGRVVQVPDYVSGVPNVLPRISRTIIFNRSGARGPVTGPPQQGQDIVSTAAMMTAQFNDGTSRPLMIRGLEDSDTVINAITGVPQPDPSLVGGLVNYQGALITNLVVERRFDPTIATYQVMEVSKDPTQSGVTQFTMLQVPQVTFPLRTVVRFTGVPKTKLPWLKGIWPIVSSAPNTFDIAYGFNLASPVFPSAMKVQVVGYTYPAFLAWTFRDFRTRQTGRPIGLTRGRAPGIPFRRLARAAGA